MARGKIKADHRADNRGGPWAGLPHCVLDSLAYRDLSLWARAILIELVREMNGYNNGEIGLSQRQMGERIGTSNYRRIGPAIAELMEHGLIDVTAEGKWKQRLARQYRLTFVNTGKPGHYKPATNEYRNWAPRAKSGVATVSARPPVPAATVATEPRLSADPVATDRNGKLPKTSFASADPVASLISKPYPSAETEQANQSLIEPENASGPSANLAAAEAEEAQHALRDKITAHWNKLDGGGRKAWASGQGLSPTELRDFVISGAHIPFPKLLALRSAAAGRGAP